MTSSEKTEIGKRFRAALLAKDWASIRALLTDDATWALPADDLVSGKAIGADDVTALARKIAGVRLNVALICRLRDDKIAEIETYLSDVDGMSAFFA